MCGIFGAVGDKNAVLSTVEALEFLEYRGYDSAGVAYNVSGKIEICKTVGRVDNLKNKLVLPAVADCAIGHTRWATHGAVCNENAHPFLSAKGNFAVVHNGIIENYAELKKELTVEGYKFSSQTDSEVVAHLLEKYYRGNALQAVLSVANRLTGAVALAILTRFDELFAVKRRSPLIVGKTGQGYCVCSDVRCISSRCSAVATLADGTVCALSKDRAAFYGFDGKIVQVEFAPPLTESVSVPKGDKMLSEIYDIPRGLRAVAKNYKFGKIFCNVKTGKIRRIYLIGCGTAYNSGLAACSVARKLLPVDCFAVHASEFTYDNYPCGRDTLAVFISQSGETADTVCAAEKAKQCGAVVLAITNTVSSTLAGVCKIVVGVHAGAEYAVASTKAYNCQLATLILLLADFGKSLGCVSADKCENLCSGILRAAACVDEIFAAEGQIESLAEEIKSASAVFFIGRKGDYATAAESSLKLKEITYIHSEAYPAGELKHGTLALMEKGVAVIAFSTECDLKNKTEGSVAEAEARGATTVTVSPYCAKGKTFTLPTLNEDLYGIISVVPMQLLAYHTAKKLGRDVDKPRNLAKSVTVE